MEPDKPALRGVLKQRLAAITPSQRQAWSAQAATHLLSVPEYQAARAIMLFVSMASEIDTTMLLEEAWRSGRTVAVPRARMADRSMQAVVVRNLDQDMLRTPIGVLEPRGGELLEIARIDLVVVPGLGFGQAGQRIGRGAGFYDRFLQAPALRAIRCGFGFDCQIVEGDAIPMTPRDAWLAMLVTESGVRRF